LLFALGLFIQNKPEYQTNVPMERSLADRIGAFWLIACAFGPFFGWIVTAFPPTIGSWKWQYLTRAFLSVVLPVITATPLVPYARGKAALIAIPLLLVITALPILSCLWVLGDLHHGAETVVVDIWRRPPTSQFECVSQTPSTITCDDIQPSFAGAPITITWLPHTRRVLFKGRVMN
jgi:MFS family permease